MKQRCLKSFLFVILLASVETGFAWGVTGHRVVAEIAQRHLSSRAAKNIKKLTDNQPLAFWANWADFIKSDTSWRHAGHWHYVDLPGHMEKEPFITGLKQLKGPNLYSKILELQLQLKDPAVTEEQKVIALRFLIHLVGDLGQPLHVGRDEDQGGNKIQVTWFGEASNLHRVWDEHLVDFQQWSYTEYATILDVVDKDQINQWQSTAVEDWFYESHVLSDKVYDQIQPNAKLSYQYNYIFVQDLNQQLLKSGIRLAKILNEIFG